MDQESSYHIAVYPTPGMGHLIPILEFAKRLTHLQPNKFSFTLIIPGKSPLSQSQQSFLNSLPTSISYTALPPINLDDIPQDGNVVETETRLTMSRSLPDLRNVLNSLLKIKNLVALVVDLFATEAFDIAEELNLPKYVFFPTAAINLSIFLHLVELNDTIPCEFKDHPAPIQLPGCMPINGKDLLNPIQDRKKEVYNWVLRVAKKYKLAEGIIVNTFEDLEPGALKAIHGSGGPKVYPVGPLAQSSSKKDFVVTECIEWLNDQPTGSVLYVSFGSGGTLSNAQFLELATGLELSDQKFLWVVKRPNDGAANSAYLDQQTGDALSLLPEGFLERVKGRGFVVKDWAPQAQILSHGSTGGFLTHCGWNSTLEAVTSGVPLIAWPLYAEQRTNAAMLNESLKVAVRPKESENGVVGRYEVARVVKSLMEGEEGKEVRSRMRELKIAAGRVASENGSSSKSLLELASKWTS